MNTPAIRISLSSYLRLLRATNLAAQQPGQAILELALMAPLLCLILFAIIDYSRALNFEQEMVDLTRQGSNMASRGTTLSAAATSLAQNSAPLNLTQNGLVIISSVARVNNVDTITGQSTSGALSLSSKVGNGVNSKATVPSAVDDIFTNNSGQTIYVTEVFFTFQQLTPIAKMWNLALPATLYQVAYF
jgi:Flp pilus assembly protein TadG